MDQMLQNRIQNLIGEEMPMPQQYALGGGVEPEIPPEMLAQLMAAEGGQEMPQEMPQEMMSGDQNAELGMAIDELSGLQASAEDPVEREMYERLGDAANAPLAEQAQMLAAEGRGDDTVLAHLRPGEVVLPPEMFDDAQFEEAVENRFNELDIDPERHVVAMGIASLNPSTGLEEFGFFKKIGKAIKKVAKKIAPIAGPLANFIPGVGPLIAGAIGAATNVVAGKGLAGAISGGLSGFSVGKALGGIGSLSGSAAGSASKFAGQGFGAKLSSLRAGLGSLPGEGILGTTKEFFMPGADKQGLFKNLGNIGKYMAGPARNDTEMLQQLSGGDLELRETIEDMREGGFNDVEIMKQLQSSGSIPEALATAIGTGQSGGSLFGKTKGQSTLGLLEDRIMGRSSDPVRQGGLGSLISGMGGGGGGLNLGGLGGMAAAGLLGKLAYDEAKNKRGVALTPLTQEGSTGRYNIEAEIARRTGKDAPNPVEFGLLPAGTIPTLSGGRKAPVDEVPVTARYGGAIMSARYGGPVMPMAYKKGGNVAVEDFKRKNGGIAGEGTETSDDVPAMLSDGEFVMTGQAVRGAGAFDLAQGDGGIITLTPNGGESRDGGTALMYEMMDLFAEFADKPKSKRKKAA